LRFFFFLFLLRRLTSRFKKGGFDGLSAEHFDFAQCKAGAESATSRPPFNSYWLALLNFVCIFYKQQIQKQFIYTHPTFILPNKSHIYR